MYGNNNHDDGSQSDRMRNNGNRNDNQQMNHRFRGGCTNNSMNGSYHSQSSHHSHSFGLKLH